VPGTHIVVLGLATLDALARPGVTIAPRFDKARDEPACPSRSKGPRRWWSSKAGASARPQGAEELAGPVNALEAAEDASAWRQYVNDRLTIVAVSDSAASQHMC
jgi:D-glycerate 3-kinase